MEKVPVFILLVLILLLGGCFQNNLKQDKALENSIYSIVEDKNNSDFSIHSLTDFDWDKAFLFAPYTTEEFIVRELGMEFVDPSNISMRDDIYLLVFLNGDQVVQYAKLERQRNSFFIGEKEYLTPTNDVVYIDRH